MESTFDRFTYADGEYFLERGTLHMAIVEELLDGRPRHEAPEALFMAGGPAAGKTTLLEVLDLPPDAVILDVDVIRELLPEYGELQVTHPESAADLTHREAADVLRMVSGLALVRGHNVVFDQVGGDDEGQFSSKLRAAIDRGYRVRVCYATVAVEVAVQRARSRFETEGRNVDEATVRSKHAEASRGLDGVARLPVASIQIYDMTGETPELVASGGGGGGVQALNAVDPGRYAAFLEKGQA